MAQLEEIKYRVELMWNREFHFVPSGNWHSDIAKTKAYAERLKDMGDGKCVKSTRIVDSHGNVVG